MQLRADGPGSPKSVTLAQRRRGEFPPARDIPTPDVRLYHRAVVVAQDLQVRRMGRAEFAAVVQPAVLPLRSHRKGLHVESNTLIVGHGPCLPASTTGRSSGFRHRDVQGQLRGLVRQLSIDQFENESRRVSMGAGKSSRTALV